MPQFDVEGVGTNLLSEEFGIFTGGLGPIEAISVLRAQARVSV